MLIQRMYRDDGEGSARLEITAESRDVPDLVALAQELSDRAEIHTEGTITTPVEIDPVIIID